MYKMVDDTESVFHSLISHDHDASCLCETLASFGLTWAAFCCPPPLGGGIGRRR